MIRRLTIVGLLTVSAVVGWVHPDQETGIVKGQGRPLKTPMAAVESLQSVQQGTGRLDFLEHFVEDGLQADASSAFKARI
jgi:hypothetical protein